MRAHKFRLEMGFTIFEKQFYHFFQISIQRVQCLSLRMGTGKTGHITHIQTRILTIFYDSCKTHLCLALSIPSIHTTL